MTAPRVVGVTGATGFVGGNLARHLRNLGREVMVFSRHPAGPADRPFHLGRPIEPSHLHGVHTLVHCAWDLKATTPREIYRTNVLGTIALLRSASQAGVRRVVLVSSMSAFAGTRQVYGRAKLDCEQAVTEWGGASLRLGLVWGSPAGAMAASVARLAALPIVPVFAMTSHQFTVHRDDVDRAVTIAVDDDSLSGTHAVAHPDPVPVPDLYRGLARDEGRRPGRFVPMPWPAVYGGLRAARAARLPVPVKADSVLGLVHPSPRPPDQQVWSRRGLELRAFSSQ